MLYTRRLLSALIIMIGISSLTACSNASPKADQKEKLSKYANAIKVSFLSRDLYSKNGAITKEDKVVGYIEDKFNLELNLLYVPSPNQTEIFTKLNSMIAAGEIPDIMEARMDDLGGEVYRSLSSEGQLIDIEAFIKQHPGQYPLIEARIQDPDASRYRADDGKLYAIPRLFGEWDHAWYIRQDWLDQLGLSMPTTLDELYTVLKLFVERDLDGQKNTGLTLSNAWWLNHIYAGYTGGFNWAERNGKYIYNFNLPEIKAAFQYIHKLYAENLLDKEFFTHKPERDEIAKFTSGKAGVMIIGANFLSKVLQQLKQYKPDAEIAFLPVNMSGPNGTARISGIKFFEGIMVYKGTKDPERIFDFIEFSLSQAGKELYSYGVEGVHYKLDSEKNKIPMNDIFLKEGWQFGNRHPLLGASLDASTVLSDEALNNFDDNYKNLMRNFFQELNQPALKLAKDQLQKYNVNALKEAGSKPNGIFTKYQIGFITGELDIDQNWNLFQAQFLESGYAAATAEVNKR
jgi:putative aldouronate transport system substrate-binding protein